MSTITQHHTTPEVRTCISFSQDEVKDALVAFAKKEGYQFTGPLARNISVWFPSDSDRTRSVTLALDTEGDTPTVTKSEDSQ